MRDYQTKGNAGGAPDTISSTRFGAGELNSIAVELENAVSTSGQTLAPADGTGEVSNQLARALSVYGGGGALYYADTGAVNAYFLNPISPKVAASAYFDGLSVIFEPGYSNTGPATVNIASLGLKSITYPSGNPLMGGEISGTSFLKYSLANDRFEFLFNTISLLNIGTQYIVDSTQADQGVSSTNPETMTVYDIAVETGTSKNAVVRFVHDPASGDSTSYNFDTSIDLSSYPNLRFMIDNGAFFTRTTGNEIFKIPSPESMAVGKNQKICSAAILGFKYGGLSYPEWFGALPDDSTDCTTAIQSAIDAFDNDGIVRFGNGTYQTGRIEPHNGITLEGIGNPITSIIATQLGQPDIIQSCLKLTDATNLSVIRINPGVQNIKISLLRIDGNKTNQTTGSHGIEMPGVLFADLATYLQDTNIRIEDCAIQNCFSNGIELGIGYRAGFIDRNWIMANGGSGIKITGGPDWTFTGNQIGENVEFNVRITGGDKQRWANNEIWGADTYSNMLVETLSGYFGADFPSRNITVIGGINDYANQAGFEITGDAQNINLIGIQFDGNSAQGSGLHSQVVNNSTASNSLFISGCSFKDQLNPSFYPVYDIYLPLSTNIAISGVNQHFNNTSTGLTCNRNANYRLKQGNSYIDFDGQIILPQTTISASSDNLDVSAVSILAVNSASGNIVLRGFTGGIVGQTIDLYKSSPSNSVTLTYSAGVGDQNIVTKGAADLVFGAGNGGVRLVCNGSYWFTLNF